jgi:hypothetical protein
MEQEVRVLGGTTSIEIGQLVNIVWQGDERRSEVNRWYCWY